MLVGKGRMLVGIGKTVVDNKGKKAVGHSVRTRCEFEFVARVGRCRNLDGCTLQLVCDGGWVSNDDDLFNIVKHAYIIFIALSMHPTFPHDK